MVTADRNRLPGIHISEATVVAITGGQSALITLELASKVPT